MRIDLNGAARLVFEQLLLSLGLKLAGTRIRVVVERADFVNSEKCLFVANVAVLVRVEMDDCAVCELPRSGTQQVVYTPVNRRDREVEQIRIDLVRVVDDGRHGQLDIAAHPPHCQLSSVCLGKSHEPAISVAKALEGVTNGRIVRSCFKQALKPHSGYQRGKHIARLAADGQIPTARIGRKPAPRQDAVPRATLALDRSGSAAPRPTLNLVDYAAVFGCVDIDQLSSCWGALLLHG